MAPTKLFEPLRQLCENYIENLDSYCEGGNHPIRIGDFFANGRYEILHKLGSGGYSIVWLAYDHCNKRYAALKVLFAMYTVEGRNFSMHGGSAAPKIECNELKMMRYVADNVDEKAKMRFAVDVETVWAESVNGKHLVVVLPVNGPCLQDYMQLVPYSPDVAREISLDAARALRDLHQAGIVHGDFTTRNILLKLHNLETVCPTKIEECFGKIEEEELIPRESRFPKGSYPKVVYREAQMCRVPEKYMTREAVVIDFGLSFQVSSPPATDGTGSPYSYRAPEQMNSLEAGLYLRPAIERWHRLDEKIDIWTLACDIYEIQTRKPLFPSYADESNEGTVLAVRDVLAEIWLEEDDDDWRYLGDTGARGYDKRKTLRSRIEREEILSSREKVALYDLLKKMLKRRPSHRIGIEEVLQHPWFTTCFDPDEVLVAEESEDEEMVEQQPYCYSDYESVESEEE